MSGPISSEQPTPQQPTPKQPTPKQPTPKRPTQKRATPKRTSGGRSGGSSTGGQGKGLTVGPNPAGRVGLLWLLSLALIGWSVLAFDRLVLPFSPAAAQVAALDTDVLYDGIGLTPEQRDGIRGAIGTRPVGIVFVPEDQDDPSLYKLCTEIGARLPDLQLALIKGPDGGYGCTGDDVPLVVEEGKAAGSGAAGYEFRISGALTLVEDPVGKAQALALVHDSMVASGRLVETERDLRTPWLQVVTTLAVVIGVLAAVVLALVGLRRWALYLAAKRARRERQEALRDDLDDALAELALVVVARTPDDPRSAAGTVAADYVDLLNLARTAEGGWAELLQRARTLLESDTGARQTDTEEPRKRPRRRWRKERS